MLLRDHYKYRLGVRVRLKAARVYTHHCHLLLLLSLKAGTRFTVQWRVEGWVDLDVLLHTEIVYPPAEGHPSWY